jgi:predicted AlkP superfamily phosphohydrolase/phosphomutase
MEKEFTYPKKIKKDLLKKDYRIEPEGIRSVSDNKFFKSVIKTIDRRKDAAIDLMESNWDILTVVFNLSDATQHRFWKEGKMNRIYSVYKRIDKSIGEIIKKVETPRVIVMSDHGFGRVAKINFYLNTWLRKNEYLKLKSGKNYTKNFEKIYIFLRKFGLDKLKYLVLNKFDKIRKPGEANIKWGETRAWGRTEDDTCLVYINKEYFEKGSVKKEDYEKVRENLINKIKEIKHPGTGEKIVNQIWKKEELYDEDDEAPDIIFKIKQKYKGKDTFESRVFIDIPKKARIGWHTSKGIFIASGPNIKSEKLDNAKLIDVAPTILAMYGIRGEMDGRVLDIFKKKPRIKEEKKNKKEEKEDKNVFNNKDKEKIKERLKALGYM